MNEYIYIYNSKIAYSRIWNKQLTELVIKLIANAIGTLWEQVDSATKIAALSTLSLVTVAPLIQAATVERLGKALIVIKDGNLTSNVSPARISCVGVIVNV